MTEHSEVPTDPSEFACVDFVNSAFSDHVGRGTATDRLESPQWRRWFLDRYDLTPDDPGAPPFGELAALRRNIRRILHKWSEGEPLSRRDVRYLDERTSGAPVRLRVAQDPDGVDLRHEPVTRSWAWVIAGVAASAVELLRDGEPARLKTCGNPDCSWVFYDNTISRTRRFCSATPCGSLMRVRRFRQRA